jgi:hypothetical protein
MTADWPVPVATERRILRELLEIIEGTPKEGKPPVSARTKIMAANSFTMLQKVSLEHQASDRELKRPSLAEMVEDAERRAEIRRSQRET